MSFHEKTTSISLDGLTLMYYVICCSLLDPIKNINDLKTKMFYYKNVEWSKVNVSEHLVEGVKNELVHVEKIYIHRD